MEVVIEEAAALLANCGGASSAGVITRVLTFPSKLGLISLSLKDLPLENGDLASIGSQTWGGACVLAELLATDPAGFGLTEVAPLRVLELGSGTGLVGMAFARAAELASREPHVTIICTDFYPSVLKNLAANIAVNFPAENGSGPLISSHFLDWSTFLSDETASLPPFNLPFDLILGADIVYEPEHAAWIYACVAKLLRPPDREDHASTFHLVIPLRATHKLESSTLESVFDARNNTSVTEWKLCILRKEIIVCEVEAGGNKELEYAYYKIGWKHW
jgi:predicted nicotinamide N-methyase